MKDENDKAQEGTLPEDLTEGTVISDGPRILTVRDLLESSMKNAFDKSPIKYCTTSHYKIDDKTGGLRDGFVWVFGAATGWGKSSWLVSVADENIKIGKTVMIVSSEDTEEIYGDRLLARRSRIDAKRLRDRELTPDEMQLVTNTVAEGEQLPVFVDARDAMIEPLIRKLDVLIPAYNIDLIAFDYLQEFSSTERHQDNRLKFKHIAAEMRRCIKRHKKTGIIFSQLTLDNAKQKPDKYDIRDCKDVVNAAEAVLLGFTPQENVYREDKTLVFDKGSKCIIIDKCKTGDLGVVQQRWDPISCCFDNMLPPSSTEVDQYDDFQDGL